MLDDPCIPRKLRRLSTLNVVADRTVFLDTSRNSLNEQVEADRIEQ